MSCICYGWPVGGVQVYDTIPKCQWTLVWIPEKLVLKIDGTKVGWLWIWGLNIFLLIFYLKKHLSKLYQRPHIIWKRKCFFSPSEKSHSSSRESESEWRKCQDSLHLNYGLMGCCCSCCYISTKQHFLGTSMSNINRYIRTHQQR